MFIEVKESGKLKIPNKEVLHGWSEWITSPVAGAHTDKIFSCCVNGPVTAFVNQWPAFMEAALHSKLVAKNCGASSRKTPERLYRILLLGVLYSICGWEVNVESPAGLGFINIRITSTQRRATVLIKLKSSGQAQSLERDADEALERIVTQNCRIKDQLYGVDHIREYGIASYRLESVVKGRYLVRAGFNWVERDDPAVVGGSG